MEYSIAKGGVAAATSLATRGFGGTGDLISSAAKQPVDTLIDSIFFDTSYSQAWEYNGGWKSYSTGLTQALSSIAAEKLASNFSEMKKKWDSTDESTTKVWIDGEEFDARIVSGEQARRR